MQFAERYAPLYERRKAIVTGAIEPTADEVSAGEAVDEDEDGGATIGEVDEDDKTKGIPDFWLTALRNHVGISELSESDPCAPDLPSASFHLAHELTAVCFPLCSH